MDFFDVLVRYETFLWNHVDEQLGAHGSVSLSTATALRVVRRHEGLCRVQEIRADLGISVGAASKLVDRLERDGLAVRRAHPTDRRSSLVALTQAGDLALAEGVSVQVSTLAAHFGDESAVVDTAAVLHRLLSRLVEPASVVSR